MQQEQDARDACLMPDKHDALDGSIFGRRAVLAPPKFLAAIPHFLASSSCDDNLIFNPSQPGVEEPKKPWTTSLIPCSSSSLFPTLSG